MSGNDSEKNDGIFYSILKIYFGYKAKQAKMDRIINGFWGQRFQMLCYLSLKVTQGHLVVNLG